MIPDNEIRQRARARLKVKESLNKVFLASLGLPVFIALFVDQILTPSYIIFWTSIYCVLATINILVWRCSSCERPLRLFKTTHPPRFCRHCGVFLFPEAPLKNTHEERERHRVRPVILNLIILLGLVFCCFGFLQQNLYFVQIGGGGIVLSLMSSVFFRQTTRRTCRSCGYIGIHGQHCENCGSRYLH